MQLLATLFWSLIAVVSFIALMWATFMLDEN